jgi:hypothetical protein
MKRRIFNRLVARYQDDAVFHALTSGFRQAIASGRLSGRDLCDAIQMATWFAKQDRERTAEAHGHLRKGDLRMKLDRGTCQECNQQVPQRKNGVAREHLTLRKTGKCRGSGRPTTEAIAAADAMDDVTKVRE